MNNGGNPYEMKALLIQRQIDHRFINQAVGFLRTYFACVLTVSVRLILSLSLSLSFADAAEPTTPKTVSAAPAAIATLLKASCLDCHDADVQKGNLRLDNLSAPGADESTMHSWIRIYDRVAAGEMPPPKKSFTESQRKKLIDSVGAEITKAEAARQRTNGRVVLRRLSANEYQHIVRDLFALPELEIADFLPIDQTDHGIENVAHKQQLSYAEMTRYLEAAETTLETAATIWPKPTALKKRHGAMNSDNEPNEAQGASRIATAPTESGYYRISFQAQSASKVNNKLIPFSANQVVSVGVAQGRLRGRFLKTFDLTPQSKKFDFVAWINAGESVIMHGADLPINGGPKVQIADKNAPSSPVVSVEWCETEGPLVDEWPPKSYQALFGNLPIEKWTAGGGSLPPRALGMVSDGDRRTKNIPGGPYYVKSANPAADSTKLLRNFMERAYRRNVNNDEVAVMQARVMTALSQKICFHDALLIAYKAILCSPDFLFVTEKMGPLPGEQLATRLSLYLWRSLPDQRLLDLGRSGALIKRETLMAESKRLLEDPRSNRFIDDFATQWLELDLMHSTSPDKQLYPEYYNDKMLVESMRDETHLYVREMVRMNLPTTAVVSSNFTFVNERLAQHYGFPPVSGSEMRKVTLPANSIRGGILTQASMMKLSSNGFSTSPVKRGIWVLDRILGTPPPNPPPDAGAIEPDTRGATTIRDILDKHRSIESCASCHKLIDPPGFALESFDVMGGYRERYRSIGKGDAVEVTVPPFRYKTKIALPVDASGEYQGKSFKDVLSFKKIMLTEDRQIARNITNRLVTQATGATVSFSERAEIEKILDATKSNGYGLQSLMLQVVTSPMFLNK